MRDILFRAKKIKSFEEACLCDDPEWVVGLPVSFDTMDDVRAIYQDPWNTHRIYPDTLGQYTGLNDKNGKMIFEGDIVTTEKDGELQFDGFIVYGHGSFEIRDPDEPDKDGYCLCLAWSEGFNIIVDGNIYDNGDYFCQ